MDLAVHATALLKAAHGCARFNDAMILPTAEAISRMGGADHVAVWALAEALQYHLAPGPAHPYRTLEQALADCIADGRSRSLLARIEQVIDAVRAQS